jgi:hypothetical protein
VEIDSGGFRRSKSNDVMETILQYESFLNEAMDKNSAINNIIEIVKSGSGWIDPDYAIEMFSDLTGIPTDSDEIDSMLVYLGNKDLLYYESNGEKGKKVDLEKFLEVIPHNSPDSGNQETNFSESEVFKIKGFDEFIKRV